ncbi:MAG: Lrp/AsnC ligand binding domain-containing protein [Candidatus Caldarchaeales archaeon]|nr:Lrp/AsnC ligand binding domain-containing protein [Candidatus Caldarchaeales archaeon]
MLGASIPYPDAIRSTKVHTYYLAASSSFLGLLGAAGGVRALIQVLAESRKLESVGEQLARLPETLDVYEVTGEFDIVASVLVPDVESLRRLVSDKILRIEGVRAAVTTIVLHTYKINGEVTWE